MNNATFFKTYKRAKAAYDKWAAYLRRQRGGFEGLPPPLVPCELEFAMAEASTALVFEIGELVRFETSDHGWQYGIVSSYFPSREGGECLDSLSIRTAEGTVHVRAGDHDKFKADIPQEIVEIVRQQLAANCPLKEPSCRKD